MRDDAAAARDAAKLATKIARHFGCKCSPVKPGDGEFAPFQEPRCLAQAVAMDAVTAAHLSLAGLVDVASSLPGNGRLQ